MSENHLPSQVMQMLYNETDMGPSPDWDAVSYFKQGDHGIWHPYDCEGRKLSHPKAIIVVTCLTQTCHHKPDQIP